jgi:bloom syndrome protein
VHALAGVGIDFVSEVTVTMAKLLNDAISGAARMLGFDFFKPQQLEAVYNFMLNKDVFVALPTGFSKSLIFGILPKAFELYLGEPAIVLVVTPLTALMIDFRDKFVPLGVSAEFLGEFQTDADVLKQVVDGQHQLVFISPKNLLDSPKLRNMLLSPIYQHRLRAVVVDEAHCIDKWYMYA